MANRESAQTGVEGRTISLIDTARAAAGGADAERARVMVGTNNASVATRPFAVAFTRDGRHVVATCFRSNTVSLVDVEKALALQPAEVARLELPTPDGGPSRPRGVVITPDGRYATITGGAKTGPGSSMLFLVEVPSLTLAGHGDQCRQRILSARYPAGSEDLPDRHLAAAGGDSPPLTPGGPQPHSLRNI